MIEKIRITLLIVTCATCTFAQTDSATWYYLRSKEALTAADTSLFYSMSMKALRVHPYHPTLLYEGAVASAMMNADDSAIELLQKAIHVKADVDLNHAAFKGLAQPDALVQLINLQVTLLEPVLQSDTAFVIKDRTLHIESIARGPSNTFYCGSIHKRKIIQTDDQGNFQDFVPSGYEGLTSVFAVKVDKNRNILWACASPLPEMINFDSTARPAVFAFDLKTKKLLSRFVSPDNRASIFGDLVLDRQGAVYVSDSRNNIIYKVNEKKKTLDEFFTSPEFWNLQGITFTPDGKTLFIADYIKGVYKLQLPSMQLTKLRQRFDRSTKSIDGLTFYQNSLIAIQNGIFPMRVTRYFLNDANDEMTHFRIIDSRHPAFNEPTIGFADGDIFYYVANSLWSGYRDGKLKPADELQDVVILKADLKQIR